MPPTTNDPLFEAVRALAEARDGLTTVLKSIDAATPPKESRAEVHADFRAALWRTLSEAERSLSIAGGNLATALRWEGVNEMVSASAARAN